ncbi:MAG TPA: alanine--tRNA ligase [Dehalococcoidia bacterium]|jgi:alanyl-tRNA synthetase|nr:alanine--tRNA ligase [Dehalococcoidia bacterium]MDP6273679.1 alanine--tRNA ligase [Dehalococcoidia bacterium]MDP7160645.1 alanine--tRNA ligase [Dehalococcoidia bacterium]MDP7213691.1 alanine--tRNA ligase [Dehalococcoidia bacterium]MDP7514978.1 alanine--tRNA ligase [Dehalococcoidia bacterium]
MPRSTDEIREVFLKYFEGQDHLRMPAASLIPAGDPTLLLTNSGMAQFKAYFAGESAPPHPRLTTSQKSFRTTDIDEVGDATHLTLFEMLGNFSFGDYFKKEACEWSLDLMVNHLGFDRDRLYITIYTDDDEAEQVWLDLGMEAERIYRFGDEDNWWGPAGAEGPCGPCSELHYYRGSMDDVPALDDPIRKNGWGPNTHDDFLEVYNLVFTQFYRDLEGNDTPLPNKNIDTGMGLERAAAVLQDVTTLYDTDVFVPVISKAEELAGRQWGADPGIDRALGAVAEHARSASFLIGDGVVPGNTGRGYVLRRIIRRAVRFGLALGIEGPFIGDVAVAAMDQMCDVYPELKDNRPFILRVMEIEEESFARAVAQGTRVLDGMFEYREAHGSVQETLDATVSGGITPGRVPEFLRERGFESPEGDDSSTVGMRAAYEAIRDSITAVASSGDDDRARQRTLNWPNMVSGTEAFLLYDTYGFPPELVREDALDRYMVLTGDSAPEFAGDGEMDRLLDRVGFEEQMEAQRERGRASGSMFGGDIASRRVYESLGIDDTPFRGYETLTVDTQVVGIIKDGDSTPEANEGDQVEIILHETPFYAERGGQMGDAGIVASDGVEVEITDTQNSYSQVNVHTAVIKSGAVHVGDSVAATVNEERRERIRRNHTATHLVHSALRQVLGTHVRQTGSLVAPDRLRFDFTHVAAMTPDEIRQVQDIVNDKIRENHDVIVEWSSYREAIDRGALAFFGDKYEADVRTIQIDAPWSYELCGGTHMAHTGGIGAFFITTETGIGSGTRRLEALTGKGAEEYQRERFGVLADISAKLRTPVLDLNARIEAQLDELDEARRTVARLEREALLGGGGSGPSASESAVDVDGAKVIVLEKSGVNAKGLRELGDHLRDQLGSGIVVVGGELEGKPTVIAMVTRDLVEQGHNAGAIVRGIAEIMNGRGGGSADVAQAGGSDPSLLGKALEAAPNVVRETLASSKN